MTRNENVIHPGEILSEEFLKPMGISQNKLVMDIRIPATRINAIVQGNRSITADTALRLGKYFGTGPDFWLNLQNHYDLCISEMSIETELAGIKAVQTAGI